MACHSHRGSFFFPTKLHISSTSASSTRSRTTSTWLGSRRSIRGWFTEESEAPFFQLVQYSSRADAQHSCGIAHPATIEAQIYHLLFDLGRAAFVGGVEQEGLVGAVGIVAAIALFSGVGLAP